jgi:arylsulfatase A-like enzyme
LKALRKQWLPVCLAAGLAIAQVSSFAGERPNVLLIVLDDFGYNDLAINNGSDSPTPNLDQLARDGIRFTRHYAESSCTASRAALLTGRYPARLGYHPAGAGLPTGIETLPERLGAHGYLAHMIGKWHAGDAHRLSRPEFHGFPRWFGFMSQVYLAGPHDAGGYRPGPPTYLDPWLEDESGELRRYRGQLTDILTDRALQFVREAQAPWFLYLPFYAPHDPLQPHQRFAANYPDTPAGRYQALKSQLDAGIGKLLDQLERSGERDSTLVIVVSDNGGTARHWPSNAPFDGAKAGYGEGGVRTPLLLSWPGRWEGGEVITEAVSIMDIYPTVVEALALEPAAGLDGRSLFSRDEPRELRWFSHSLFLDDYAALSADGNWRLQARTDSGGRLTQVPTAPGTGEAPVGVPPPGLQQQLDRSTLEWFRQVTEVTGLTYSDRQGWREFTGDGFRRSPLAGQFTLGLVLRRDAPPGAAQRPATTLLKQRGYLDISDLGNSFALTLDGHTVSAPWPDPADRCVTLAISAQLAKSNQIRRRQDSASMLQLFVNGALAEQASFRNPALNPVSPLEPLRIQIDPGAGWHMPAAAEPLISTRFIRSGEIAARVHPELQRHCRG